MKEKNITNNIYYKFFFIKFILEKSRAFESFNSELKLVFYNKNKISNL